MGAVGELAPAQAGGKIREGILQVLLEDHVHLVGVEGGKARGVHHIGVASQAVQLHVAGGMPAPAQLFRNLTGGKGQLRAQAIENAGFAHPGVAGEGRQLAFQGLTQFLNSLAGFGAGADDLEARLFVDCLKLLRRVQIALVDAKNAGDVLIPGDGGHPVDEKRLRHRIHVGGKEHQGIYIGHGGPDEAVGPGQNGFHHSLAPLQGDLHQVAGEGGDLLLPQDSPAPAGHNPLRQLNIIKPTEGADNASALFISHCL